MSPSEQVTDILSTAGFDPDAHVELRAVNTLAAWYDTASPALSGMLPENDPLRARMQVVVDGLPRMRKAARWIHDIWNGDIPPDMDEKLIDAVSWFTEALTEAIAVKDTLTDRYQK